MVLNNSFVIHHIKKQRELVTNNLITLEDELANALYIQLELPYAQNLK